ncbi:uncharacterized protein SCHCODRAFT_02644074 [Schizophyllum commune H4-8]|uniref:uncharacterized protein n=1 Tax=Schizophyllum commune (strain H4-8 / FGSC 9210) TaxID=578458 RepID=UPI00216022ED|nr:uncharacterized protein SCHCODRAFT_02644074 [Schizophyllum commune H4-8]KAI5885678.1 hypothetical protein SCHCODRAFT_02644074 [Schizophyllum commune H4-8]
MADTQDPSVRAPDHFKPFGLSGARRGQASENWRDRDEYEDDRPGEELGEEARVWHVLFDEGTRRDAKALQGLRDHLDVDLVFSGLFAAVVSAFVVQSSQALQPDHAKIGVALLSELIALQRAVTNGSPVVDVPSARVTPDTVTATALDYWTNRLWYLSLLLGLLAAFLAFIVRSWLYAYDTEVYGSPRRRALVRHYRRVGLERWNVSLIVLLLPTMLHASMLLFFIGLGFYLNLFDAPMSYFVTALTASFYCFYLWSTFMPVFNPQCPYRSPLTDWVYWVKSVLAWIYTALLCQSRGTMKTLKTSADHEWEAVLECSTTLTPNSLERAMRESPSSFVALVIIQASSCFVLGRNYDQNQCIYKDDPNYALFSQVLNWLYGALYSRPTIFEWELGRENELQRLACCLLLVPVAKLKTTLGTRQYYMCGIRIWTALKQAIMSREVTDTAAPALCATVFALGQRLKTLDHQYNVPLNCALQQRMIEVYVVMAQQTPHTRLRLRPVVWEGMLDSLRSRHPLASTEICVPFALVLWRSLNCSTIFPAKDESLWNTPSSTIMTLQAWLCATKQTSLVTQVVMHRFFCRASCKVPAPPDDHLSSAYDASTISSTSIAQRDSAWLHMACRAIDLYVQTDEASRGAAFSDHLGFLAEQLISTLATNLRYGPLDTALQTVERQCVSYLFESNFRPRPSPSLEEIIKPESDEGLPDDLVGPFFWFLVGLMRAVVDAPASHDRNAAPQGDKATKEVAHATERHVERHREYLIKTLVEDVDSLELLRPLAMTIITHPKLAALSTLTDALADKMALLLRRLASGDSTQSPTDAGQPQGVDAGPGDQPPQDLVWCMWVDAFCRGAGQASATPSDALHGALLSLSRIHQDAWAREVDSTHSQPLSLPKSMTLRSPRSREVLAELVPNAQAVFSDPILVSVPPILRRTHRLDVTGSDSLVPMTEIVTVDECHRRMRADMPADDAQSHAPDAGKLEDDGAVGQWTIFRRYSAMTTTRVYSALRWTRRHLASTQRSEVVDEEMASHSCYLAPQTRSSDIESDSPGRGIGEEVQRANS